MLSLLRQSGTGLAFSPDLAVLDWLGIPVPATASNRKMEFKRGRGFFFRQGKFQYVQTPFVLESLAAAAP